MKQNRRNFIITSGLIGGAVLTPSLFNNAFGKNINIIGEIKK